METSKSSSTQEEEEYIEMELITTSSPSKEFEFQMPMIPLNKEPALPSLADELFYKGKLLPLHLPPRLQMVQKLQTNIDDKHQREKPRCSDKIPFISVPARNSSTPLESCNIPPTESFRASCELNPDEYFFALSSEVSGFACNNSKRSWPRKLSFIRQYSLSPKLKALKSLFIKETTECTDESSNDDSRKPENIEEQGSVSRAKDYLGRYIKAAKKIPFGHFEKHGVGDDSFVGPRRSFSDAIKRHCGAKSSSSSSSSTSSSSSSSSWSIKSSGFYEIKFVKRGVSVDLEFKNAIEGAIAHCKKSQQPQHCSIEHEMRTMSCISCTAAKVAACESNAKSELSRISIFDE
ncbi:hypothetical protein Droror1_Dr00008718 [Drosera rotundifolia]